MKLSEVVEDIGTVTELKRIASAYVIDYRNLSTKRSELRLLKQLLNITTARTSGKPLVNCFFIPIGSTEFCGNSS